SVTLYLPGEIRVGAIIGGKPGFAAVHVKPQSVARIDVDALKTPIAVGAGVQLSAVARTPNGDPRADALIAWSSETPAVATVAAAGLAPGLAAGRARIVAKSGTATAGTDVAVVANPVRALAVTPRAAQARTGDVVLFNARATGANGA